MNRWDRSRRSGAVCPDRRTFLALLGSAGATRLLRPWPTLLLNPPQLLFVGSCNRSDEGTIHILSVMGGRCEHLGSVSSEQPVSLAVHPTQPILYAANGISRYRYEPRGTIEAFLVDPAAGRVKRLARQALSLSATEPRSLAVAPDGSSVLVAASGGGAYNVLPLDAGGIPGPPATILKQVGRAGPTSVLFGPRQGIGIAADPGADRLDLLAEDAKTPHTYAVVSRASFKRGFGPSALALHRGGDWLVAAHRERPALTLARLGRSAQLDIARDIPLGSSPVAIAWHPRRDLLYVVLHDDDSRNHLQVWRLDSPNRALHRIAETTIRNTGFQAMHCESASLYLACSGGVMAATLDPGTGIPLRLDPMVSIPGAVSFAALSTRERSVAPARPA